MTTAITMTEPLRRALLHFVALDTYGAKIALLSQTPGLRSPVVCTVLCTQAEEELRRGHCDDALLLLLHLELILHSDVT